jgi:hypothetical protein
MIHCFPIDVQGFSVIFQGACKSCYTNRKMKIYLDTCCLNRPFDDQRQPRIRLEAEAVTLILEKFRQREWNWVGSEVLIYEIEQTTTSFFYCK